jgi:hypothetical protein
LYTSAGMMAVGRQDGLRLGDDAVAINKVRRRKGGAYPLSHLYGHFGLVRLCRLGHDVPWVKA